MRPSLNQYHNYRLSCRDDFLGEIKLNSAKLQSCNI